MFLYFLNVVTRKGKIIYVVTLVTFIIFLLGIGNTDSVTKEKSQT